MNDLRAHRTEKNLERYIELHVPLNWSRQPSLGFEQPMGAPSATSPNASARGREACARVAHVVYLAASQAVEETATAAPASAQHQLQRRSSSASRACSN